MSRYSLHHTAQSIGINTDKLPANPTVGKWYRLPILGKALSNRAGSVRLLAHGVAFCQNFITGESVTWFSDDLPTDPRELEALKKKLEYAQIAEKRERERAYMDAAKSAENMWQNYCQKADDLHPYLLSKDLIPTAQLRQHGKELVIPVYDVNSPRYAKMQSLQFISPNGAKRFLKGGKMKAGFNVSHPYRAGDDIFVGEGWATMQSLKQQWKYKGWFVTAFNAGNLVNVATAIGVAYPQAAIVIVADNDEGGTGLREAVKAYEAVNANAIIMPEFTDQERELYQPTDWNDRYLLDKGKLKPNPKKKA